MAGLASTAAKALDGAAETEAEAMMRSVVRRRRWRRRRRRRWRRMRGGRMRPTAASQPPPARAEAPAGPAQQHFSVGCLQASRDRNEQCGMLRRRLPATRSARRATSTAAPPARAEAPAGPAPQPFSVGCLQASRDRNEQCRMLHCRLQATPSARRATSTAALPRRHERRQRRNRARRSAASAGTAK